MTNLLDPLQMWNLSNKMWNKYYDPIYAILLGVNQNPLFDNAKVVRNSFDTFGENLERPNCCIYQSQWNFLGVCINGHKPYFKIVAAVDPTTFNQPAYLSTILDETVLPAHTDIKTKTIAIKAIQDPCSDQSKDLMVEMLRQCINIMARKVRELIP